jgi:sialic acid synthase SpsE/sugar phosphate isomerase/epimerase
MKNINKQKLIIAEIGINHDGDIQKAKQLIDIAYDSKVDAIKFQYRNLNNAYSINAKEIGDEMLSKEINRNYLSPDELIDLSTYAASLGLQVGISFFDKKDILDFDSRIEIFDFFKTPSVELSNSELIKALLELNKHLYISLGAHNEVEIVSALGQLPDDGWTPMHCISNYPVTLENAQLGYIKYLQNHWGVDVGYSSHDDDWEVCLLAMQMGVTVIERHITFDRKANGLDHSSSSTPDHFKKMSNFFIAMPILLSGDSPKIANQGELLNKQNLGRSYYATHNLKKGYELNLSDLVYLSPHTGLDKQSIEKYIGKPLLFPLAKGEVVTKSLFEVPAPISKEVISIAKEMKLSLPVRLHDYKKMEGMFPIGAFEFHLSFDEVLSEIDLTSISSKNRYSIHLPDYINPTQLMDPFSKDKEQKKASLVLLDRTAKFAENLQILSGNNVPIVGSFSVVHENREDFYEQHGALLKDYLERGVEIVPQWLPPIAWYFGGSIGLNVMNELEDVKYLKLNDLGVCMDVCHLILGRNYYDFSATEIIDNLESQIKHIHIADALGIDGEGLAIGEGTADNIILIKKLLKHDCLKVIEVWQGHLNNGEGFREAIITLTNIYKNEK